MDDSIEFSYASLWKTIIRPPRDDYSEEQLGDKMFVYKGKTYLRKNYSILNKQGNFLQASLIEPEEESRPSAEMPLIVYMHGNSSSRLEGMKVASEVLKRDINLFIFDFSGCGLSEGEYISLGFHEKDDLKIVIDFVEKLPGVAKIGVWGRSMGASTCMMYCHSDQRISAVCFDSPFSDFTKLAKEIVTKQVKLPDFVLDTALSFIRQTIIGKNNTDIFKLCPINYSAKTFIPAFFLHAMNDDLIPLEHSLTMFEQYAGEKSLNICEGNHNTNRQKHIQDKIGKFFDKYLKEEESKENTK